MSSRIIYLIAAIMALTVGFACWCRAPLIWDGAYQFDWTLESQYPYAYLTRFHTLIIWWPTVWASKITSNVMVLQSIYGLPFLLAPIAALLVSWWVVKDDAPQLILWVIFGVAIATLPGQIFVINDSIFQQHLFWPVFMGLLVPLTWPKRIVLGLLAIFQFVHPLGVMLLLGGALAALTVSLVDAQRRRPLRIGAGIMLALCMLAVAKIVITNHIPDLRDTYAEQEATWINAKTRFVQAVLGPPLEGMGWMWMAGALLLVQPLLRRRGRMLPAIAGAIAIGCVVGGTWIWFQWAHGPSIGWVYSIDYRRWVGPLTIPFFLFATVETFLLARRRENQDKVAQPLKMQQTQRLRGTAGFLLAVTFAAVLSSQCATWRRVSDQLLAQVRSYPTVIVSTIDPQLQWTLATPLTHWGTGNFIAVMEGKTPTKILLDPSHERLLRGDPLPEERWANDPKTGKLEPRCQYYPIAPNKPPGPQGWFDFRPLLAKLAAESPATQPAPH